MKKRLLYFFLLTATVTAVILSPQMSASVRETVTFCTATLIPSLFPFLVLSKLLVSSGFCACLGKAIAPITAKALGLSGNCAGVFAIGLFSGYPVGASSASELLKSGGCTKKEAQRLLCFCNNCGPAFMIGAVGGMLSSVKTGVILWLIQLASVFITASVSNLFRTKIAQTKLPEKSAELSFDVPSAVRASASAMAVICAFAVFFSAICGIMRATEFFGLMCALRRILEGEALMCAEKMLYGVLDVTTAVGFYVKNTPVALAVTSFACTFGGMSVHMQTAAVCAESGLSLKKYIIAKLIQGAIAFAITYFTYLILP